MDAIYYDKKQSPKNIFLSYFYLESGKEETAIEKDKAEGEKMSRTSPALQKRIQRIREMRNHSRNRKLMNQMEKERIQHIQNIKDQIDESNSELQRADVLRRMGENFLYGK